MRNRSFKALLASLLALAVAGPGWTLGPAALPAPTPIGVAGGVKGLVTVFPQGEKPIGRLVSSGAPLFLNEKITTGPKASLQVMLNDETVFTIGPNSSMVLDEFVYDPKSHAGKVTARVTNGVFKFVTGQIGHRKPSDMKVKFPAGTMGIRGTIVAGEVTPAGTLAVLVGPGPAAASAPGERVGAFVMENAGKEVNVVKPGFGTFVGHDAAPTSPAQVPQAQLNAILEATAHGAPAAKPASGFQHEQASADSSEAQNGDATAEADDKSGASGDLSNVQDVADLSSGLDNATLEAANDIGDADLAALIANNQASWDDVRTIVDGVGYYNGSSAFNLTQCNGGACASPSGTMTFNLDIDFTHQTIGSAASKVTVAANDASLAAPINETVNFAQTSFAALPGAATLAGTSASGNTTANVSLLNVGGIAGSAVAIARYSDAAGTKGNGSVTAPLTCTAGLCH